MSEERSADIVVIGAGAAGSVIARRMHDVGASVLVLEAGGSNDDEQITDTQRFVELSDGPYDWAYRTVPQVRLGGRILPWAQGRVLGGTSSLNAAIWIRGCPADFDHWAYLGNPGWSYDELLPIFRRIEDFDRGPSAVRGVGGPMPVRTEWEHGEIHAAVLAAMGELGVPANDDPNGGDILGAGWCQYNIRGRRRVSAYDAYLAPVAGAGAVEVVTRAQVRRLLFDGERCTGVEWERDGVTALAHAGSEVVVCAGAIGSPRILLLSGIGPADELAAHGIDVVLDSPGVGGNLQDHVHVALIYAAERPIEPSAAGIPTMQTNTFFKTDPALYSPNIQAPSVGVAVRYAGFDPGTDNGFSVPATILRTASRGRVRLAGPDPDVPPLIDPATYDAPGDLASMVDALRFLRGLEGTAALQEWGARELHPGPAADDDAGLPDYVRRMTHTASHPVGTCKMGVDADAVVDPLLRVRGVDGLRVADSSIMPAITSGNTHVPSLMIGERASDLLAAAHGSPGSPRPATR